MTPNMAFFMHIILSIKYFIPFVIIKNNTIFVHPIPASGRYRSIIAVFLCLIDFIDTVKTRCRSSRNCLNTIALAGLDNGNDGTVFCRFYKYPIMQMKFQTIKVNGKDHFVGGVFNIQNALLAYSYFKQLTGREFVAEMLEGNIKAQLDILQSNNPNASPVLDVLRHAYEQTKPVTDKMGYSNLFYSLSDN